MGQFGGSCQNIVFRQSGGAAVDLPAGHLPFDMAEEMAHRLNRSGLVNLQVSQAERQRCRRRRQTAGAAGELSEAGQQPGGRPTVQQQLIFDQHQKHGAELDRAGTDGRPAPAVKRLKTRTTLPSTAGTACAKQIEPMAPAVYGPIPGKSANSATLSGKRPSYCSITKPAVFFKFAARR